MIKKILAIVIISFSLLTFAIFSALSFIDYNLMARNLIAHFGIEPENIGTIKIVKFPIPYLKIETIKATEQFELEQIQAYFSLLSLVKFKPQIDLLKILNVKFYSDFNKLHIYDQEYIIDNLFKYNLQNIGLEIKNLDIINKHNLAIVNFTNCYLENSPFPLSPNISFKANNNVIGLISGVLKQNNQILDLELNIDNNFYSLKILQIYKNKKLEQGSGEYKIKDLAATMYSILPDLNHIFNKFKQNKPINIKFNILATEDAVELKDIDINSKFISGAGSINFSKNAHIPSKITLHFPQIDASSLLTSSNTPYQFNNAPSNLRFIFTDKLLQANIAIDEIIVSNNESLNKIKFSANLANNVLKVEEFSGKIQSGGEFKFIGDITQNSIRSMFDGTVQLYHKDFNSLLDVLGFNDMTNKEIMPFALSLNLKLTLIDLYLSNLIFTTDKFNISGDVSTKFIASTPQITALFNISALDFDKQNYPVISSAIEFTEHLTQDMKDRDYYNKFIAIRKLNFLANLDINISSINYKNYLFDKVNFLASIAPASIKLDNLELKTGNNYLLTSLNLDASDIKPHLSIKLQDGIITADLLSPVSLLNLRNKVINDYSLDKISLKIHGKLSKLYQPDNLLLENLKLDTENDVNLFKINNIEANLLSGKFQAIGNVLLEPYSMNFVYALNNIDLAVLSSQLPKVFHELNGVASFNGDFSTHGNSLETQLYNLTTQSEFAINNIRVSNFSIDSFIEKINSYNYYPNNIDNDLNIAIHNGQNDIQNIAGNVELQKGILFIKDVKFASRYSSGASSIAMNIYNFNVKSSTMFSFYIASDVIGTSAANTKDKNILATIPIKIEGTIVDLKKSFDASELKKIFHIETAEITATN